MEDQFNIQDFYNKCEEGQKSKITLLLDEVYNEQINQELAHLKQVLSESHRKLGYFNSIKNLLITNIPNDDALLNRINKEIIYVNDIRSNELQNLMNKIK